MDTYLRFLYEFLNEFFFFFKTIIFGIVEGIGQIFNIPGYVHYLFHG